MSGIMLRMQPVFKEKIWGGDRLHTVFLSALVRQDGGG